MLVLSCQEKIDERRRESAKEVKNRKERRNGGEKGGKGERKEDVARFRGEFLLPVQVRRSSRTGSQLWLSRAVSRARYLSKQRRREETEDEREQARVTEGDDAELWHTEP